jgi:hypothetical protein
MGCATQTFDGGCGSDYCGSGPAGSYGPVDIEVGGLAPAIDNFVPTPGIAITRLQHIQFEVTDDLGQFAAIFVSAAFPDGNIEVVWTGTQFAPRYLAGSARTNLTCGYRYTVRRAGGWYATPLRIEIVAVDSEGNVQTQAVGF